MSETSQIILQNKAEDNKVINSSAPNPDDVNATNPTPIDPPIDSGDIRLKLNEIKQEAPKDFDIDDYIKINGADKLYKKILKLDDNDDDRFNYIKEMNNEFLSTGKINSHEEISALRSQLLLNDIDLLQEEILKEIIYKRYRVNNASDYNKVLSEISNDQEERANILAQLTKSMDAYSKVKIGEGDDERLEYTKEAQSLIKREADKIRQSKNKEIENIRQKAKVFEPYTREKYINEENTAKIKAKEDLLKAVEDMKEYPINIDKDKKEGVIKIDLGEKKIDVAFEGVNDIKDIYNSLYDSNCILKDESGNIDIESSTLKYAIEKVGIKDIAKKIISLSKTTSIEQEVEKRVNAEIEKINSELKKKNLTEIPLKKIEVQNNVQKKSKFEIIENKL